LNNYRREKRGISIYVTPLVANLKRAMHVVYLEREGRKSARFLVASKRIWAELTQFHHVRERSRPLGDSGSLVPLDCRKRDRNSKLMDQGGRKIEDERESKNVGVR